MIKYNISSCTRHTKDNAKIRVRLCVCVFWGNVEIVFFIIFALALMVFLFYAQVYLPAV